MIATLLFVGAACAARYHTIRVDQIDALRTVLTSLSGGLLKVNGTSCPDNSAIHHYTCDDLGDVRTLSLEDGGRGYVGSIPTQIAVLSKLNYVDFRHNRLSGTLPTQLAQLGELQTLLLYGNYFRGPVPPGMASMPRLTLCSLELHANPTNCFDCPLPEGLNCGMWDCDNSCPLAPIFISPQTASPTPSPTPTTTTVPTTTTTVPTTTSTGAPSPSPFTTTEPVRTEPLRTDAASTEARVSQSFEARTFTHKHNNATLPDAGEPLHVSEEEPSSVDTVMSPDEIDSENMTTVIIVACISLVAVPLTLFLVCSFVRMRQKEKRQLQRMFGAQGPTYVPVTYAVPSPRTEIANAHAEMRNEEPVYGRIGTMAARAMDAGHYESPQSALGQRVPVNYDCVPPEIPRFDDKFD